MQFKWEFHSQPAKAPKLNQSPLSLLYEGCVKLVDRANNPWTLWLLGMPFTNALFSCPPAERHILSEMIDVQRFFEPKHRSQFPSVTHARLNDYTQLRNEKNAEKVTAKKIYPPTSQTAKSCANTERRERRIGSWTAMFPAQLQRLIS